MRQTAKGIRVMRSVRWEVNPETGEVCFKYRSEFRRIRGAPDLAALLGKSRTSGVLKLGGGPYAATLTPHGIVLTHPGEWHLGGRTPVVALLPNVCSRWRRALGLDRMGKTVRARAI